MSLTNKPSYQQTHYLPTLFRRRIRCANRRISLLLAIIKRCITQRISLCLLLSNADLPPPCRYPEMRHPTHFSCPICFLRLLTHLPSSLPLSKDGEGSTIDLAPCTSRRTRGDSASPLLATAELLLPPSPPPQRCRCRPRAANASAALPAIVMPLPRCLCRSPNAATALPLLTPRCRCRLRAVCFRPTAAMLLLLMLPPCCQRRHRAANATAVLLQLPPFCRRLHAASATLPTPPLCCHRLRCAATTVATLLPPLPCCR